jgi:hypothetical protein
MQFFASSPYVTPSEGAHRDVFCTNLDGNLEEKHVYMTLTWMIHHPYLHFSGMQNSSSKRVVRLISNTVDAMI